MSPPYRREPAAPPLDPRLAQLVKQGQRVELAQHADAVCAELAARKAADDQLLLSVGAYRGSPRRAAVPAVILTLATGVAVGEAVAENLVPAFVAIVIGALAAFIVWTLSTPIASRAAAGREQARVRQLPYPVQGLFETMSTPATTVRFEIDLDRGRPPPDPAVVYAAFRGVDAEARIEPLDPHRFAVWTGYIPAFRQGSMRINHGPSRPIIFDHRHVGPRTMRLVDEVLPPLHSTYGIVAVRVTPA